jgi:Xaa-Pro aminopeptidase
MLPGELTRIQEAILEENLDGWLFCNFRHRDKLADEILGIHPAAANSRLWVYAVPAGGEPLRLVHAVEEGALDALPGTKVSYISREDLINGIASLARRRWGVHISETLTAISYLDGGTAGVLKQAGLSLVSAAGLVQRFKGLLDERGVKSHEQAADHLYRIVKISWEMVKNACAQKRPLYEGEIRALMLEEMDKRNLITDHAPIVAGGLNSGNPHYDFSGSGALIREGDPIQFDIWAKDAGEGAVYADISWAGVFAGAAPAKFEKPFTALVNAREEAYRFIADELAAGRNPPGAQVDKKVRDFLTGLGYGGAIKHRTGHGIDTECHGSGANIDSVEFPDFRPLLDGSCFSLEPGLYFSDFGLRTEIDVYIQRGKPVISGGNHPRQFSLLTC